MSINTDNPQGMMEKMDAVGNMIEQMFLAHQIKDETKFREAHRKASQWVFEINMEIQEVNGLLDKTE